MSEINANFIVEQSAVNIQSDNNLITVDAEPISLNVFSLGFTAAGGQPGNLQYNDNGGLGGAANTVVSAGNVRFTNISNLKIANGSNGYFLQTDGTGNLTWAPGTVTANGNGTPVGANTQIQVTDGSGNFVSAPGFTFDNSTNVFTTPGNAVINGNISVTNNATITGNVTASYFIGDGSQLTNITAGNITVTNTASNSSSTYYPILANGLGNVQPQVDNFGNVLTYVPSSGTLNTNILDITEIKNSNGNVLINDNLDAFTILANGNITSNAVISANGNISSNAIISANGNISSNAIISANGNIISNAYFVGNGAYLTGIDTSLISNGNSNVRTYANANVTISSNGVANVVEANSTQVTINGNLSANLITGTLTTSSQPNITSVGILTDIRTNNTQIHLGNNAGNSGQQFGAIAIGDNAGFANQKFYSIAIGESAGNANLGETSIAIGLSAQINSNAVANAIAIGYDTQAGPNSIGIGMGTRSYTYSNAIAIGPGTGTTGNNAIAIGNASGAGESGVSVGDNAQSGTNSIALGKGSKATQQSTIILNATGANLTNPNGISNTFTVKPIRNANAPNALFYNPTSGEITYDVAQNLIEIVNGNSNVRIGNANSNITMAVNNVANVVVISQNLVNVQGNITATGNLSVDYANANNFISAFDINGGRLISRTPTSLGLSPLTVNSTVKVANLNSDLLDGYETSTNAVANTVVVRNTNGNIYGNFIFGDGSTLSNLATGNGSFIANGTSNIVVAANSNITVGVNGISNVAVFTTSGIISNLTGDVIGNITGNANIANFVNISNANANSNTTMYPVFVQSTGTGALNLDNAGTTITYRPSNGALTVGSLITSSVNGTNGQSIDLNDPTQKIYLAIANTSTILQLGNNSTELNSNSITLTSTNLVFQSNAIVCGSNASVSFGNIISGNYVLTTSRTVANLANANIGVGTRSFVSDANTTTFNAIVGGGGGNKVPVFSDGTNWRVG